MIVSLLLFWSIYGLIFGLFLILPYLPFTEKLAQNVAAFLLFSSSAYLSWQVTNFIWRKGYNVIIPKSKVSPEKRAVLITGCDTGFGHNLAKRLDAFGFHVYAGCLFPDGAGAEHLRTSCSDKLRIIKLDVTSDEDVADARRQVDQTIGNLKLWALVNNAGVLASTEIEMGSMKSFVFQMDVNCLGIVRVTKAFLPLLRPAQGRVVNMASLAGRFSIPGMVGYCMSKAGVVSFSEGLRREMKKWDIDVITVEPHLFKTNLCDDETQQKALDKAWAETPQDIRDVYGDCYFKGYQKFLDKVLGSARPRINLVVDTMYLAVTDQFVGPTYRVMGDLERVRVWVYQFIPDRVLDLMSYWASILQTGQPLALIKAAYEKKKAKLG